MYSNKKINFDKYKLTFLFSFGLYLFKAHYPIRKNTINDTKFCSKELKAIKYGVHPALLHGNVEN